MVEFDGRVVEKRQRIGALLYRDGPSSHEDEDFFLRAAGTESDAPKGLNCNLSMREMNKDVTEGELAGSEVKYTLFLSASPYFGPGSDVAKQKSNFPKKSPCPT